MVEGEVVVVVAVVEVEEVVAEITISPPTSRINLLRTKPMVNAIKGRSILIFRKGCGPGVRCTSSGGARLIFVVNPQLVRGRTSTPPSLTTNETPTSSRK